MHNYFIISALALFSVAKLMYHSTNNVNQSSKLKCSSDATESQ